MNTNNTTGLDMLGIFAAGEEGVKDEAPAKPAVSMRDVMEREVSLTPYAIDLWFPGCTTAEGSDKMICFLENEQELDTYLALFMSQNSYVQVVKEAEDEDGPLTAAAVFLLPRVYLDTNSPFNAASDDLCIKTAALWWQYKYGCTDAEEVLRELIAASK